MNGDMVARQGIYYLRGVLNAWQDKKSISKKELDWLNEAVLMIMDEIREEDNKEENK